MYKGIFLGTILLIVVLFMSSCNKQTEESQLLKTKIDKTNISKTIEELQKENILSLNDITLLNNGLNRLGATPDTLIGMTFKDVLESQKKLLEDFGYSALATTSGKVEMNFYYFIKYLGFKPMMDTVKNAKMNTIFYEFQNNSDKVIKKVDGYLQYFNPQNQIVKQFEVDNTEIIPAKSSKQFYKSFVHNDSERRDSIIRYFNSSLIVKWQPISIEFADGQKIEIKGVR